MKVIDAHQLEIKGRGSLGFGQILLRGYLGLSENLGGPLFRVLLHFYDQICWPLTPPPPPPLTCVHP